MPTRPKRTITGTGTVTGAATVFMGLSLRSLAQVRDKLERKKWSKDEYGRSPSPDPSLSPPDEWTKAVAQAVVVVRSIIARYLPADRVAAFTSCPAVGPETAVEMMRRLGLDEGIPQFRAAWDELASTPDGRAVHAVYDAALHGSMIGVKYEKLAAMAAAPGLEDELQEIYKGLPRAGRAGRVVRWPARRDTGTTPRPVLVVE